MLYFTWSILFVAILVQPYVGAQIVFCVILHFIVLLMTMLIDYFIIVLTRFVGPIYLWVVFGSSVVAVRVDSHCPYLQLEVVTKEENNTIYILHTGSSDLLKYLWDFGCITWGKILRSTLPILRSYLAW